ncbi:MAG: SDR family NAD(P)-dependent oxidoreductase, partial [Gammaproteobacteria bacterium]|nr:SDR family NAD(P)-dependent oxidoreductase [Gammaproteobacteria bacterium]
MADIKTAVVTGASRGIGAAIAQQLVKDGCYVIGSATSESGVKKIGEALGDSGTGVVLDLSNVDSIAQSIEQIEATGKEISILVNNAGATQDNLFMRM